jgi:hypothetical protein
MGYQFADVEDYRVDIDHYDINVEDGTAYVNALDVTVEEMEIGDVWDYDDFIQYCEAQGFTITKDSTTGEIIFNTGRKYDDNGRVVKMGD